MKRNILFILLIGIMPWAGSSITANVKLGSVFSDNMVLQADHNIKVWGTANRSETIRVEFNGKTAATRAGLDGKWEVELPGLVYGGPYKLNVYGEDTLTLKNIMVGEVWLCAGQSNMRMTVRGVLNAKEEIANARHRNIRFLTLPLSGSTEPQESFDAVWELCSPSTVANYSASGYFFGRELERELNVAIGLIDISYGGATIFTFMDEITVVNTLDTATFNGTQRQRWEAYQTRIANWEDQGRKGRRPPFPPQHFSSLCYNAMVHPIVPFANRGAIWYQGESDVAHPDAYVSWFGDYIAMMRAKFDNAEMPFYFVQLAGFVNQPNTNVPPETWAKFRIAQEQCLKHPNTGMATAMDIGMKENIHPKNKQEVGRRLALCALKQTYGKKEIVCNGPQLKSIEKRGRTLLLTFDHWEGRLKNREEGNYVQGFSAVLRNGDRIDLEGKITSGNTVEIKASDIQRLRYAFANYPVCSLYNGEGLPALPFDRNVK